MKLRELTFPYVIQEIDYVALRQAVKDAFADEYGEGIVNHVRVAHFNPNIIDVTVVAQEQQPEMDNFALALSEALRRQGIRAAIRVTSDEIESVHVLER